MFVLTFPFACLSSFQKDFKCQNEGRVAFPIIEDEGTVVVDAIRDVMRRWELNSWTDVMGYVCQMPWVSSFFEPLVVGLREEIDDLQ